MENGRIPSSTVQSFRSVAARTPVFRFNPHSWPSSSEITSVQLVLPAFYNSQGTVTVNGDAVLRETVTVGTPKPRSFVVLKMPANARRYINHTDSSVVLYVKGLQIDEECDDCEVARAEEAPLLVVQTPPDGDQDDTNKHQPGTRQKRAIPELMPRADRELDPSILATACKLHSWYVSFADMHWDTFILSPKGYTANYCAGSCSAPLLPASSVNGSNHAFVKAMYQRMTSGSDRYTTSHCVPVSYSYISVLYFDNDDDLILKRIPDMVANACACL
ncbi:growth/differentiation factor 3-like [Lingula anatina]|uniref:Growth/differentiation factor 3-like n=1 Tax=Lingula anatina TaxID=7574 RepID=A0A1S3I9Q1_LINAN|nr:growth/differentiation factor 3-like [Lingula anatina]|eukprot:XP_013394129.1 growth/differentiation factor 3-like [Lingula anatina]